jgi:hypothetical protein
LLNEEVTEIEMLARLLVWHKEWGGSKKGVQKVKKNSKYIFLSYIINI